MINEDDYLPMEESIDFHIPAKSEMLYIYAAPAPNDPNGYGIPISKEIIFTIHKKIIEQNLKDMLTRK